MNYKVNDLVQFEEKTLLGFTAIKEGKIVKIVTEGGGLDPIGTIIVSCDDWSTYWLQPSELTLLNTTTLNNKTKG